MMIGGQEVQVKGTNMSFVWQSAMVWRIKTLPICCAARIKNDEDNSHGITSVSVMALSRIMLPESALPCYLLFFWMFAMIVTTHITKDPSRQLSDCIWSLDFSKLLPLYRSKMDGWFDGSVGAYMMLADSLFCFVTTLRVQREWDRRSETGTKGKE